MARHYSDHNNRPEHSGRHSRLSYSAANRSSHRGKHSIGSPDSIDAGDSYGRSSHGSSYGRSSRDSYSDGGYSRDDYSHDNSSGDYGSYSDNRYDQPDYSSVSDEARAYSRSTSSARYAAQARKPRKKKIAAIVAIVLIAVLAVAGVAGAAWYMHVTGNLAGNKDIKMTEEAVSGEPYYVLLLGGDSRTDEKTDNRTDSIMVARVDETNKKVSIVSVPRDLRVNIEGHGMCKINSAIEYGGYDGVIKEVNEVLGIKIN